jgi:hypothetical protein
MGGESSDGLVSGTCKVGNAHPTQLIGANRGPAIPNSKRFVVIPLINDGGNGLVGDRDDGGRGIHAPTGTLDGIGDRTYDHPVRACIPRP